MKLNLSVEFEQYHTDPETVSRGFIADLCGIRNVAAFRAAHSMLRLKSRLAIHSHPFAAPNPAAHPRPDGLCSHGSDERRRCPGTTSRCGYGVSEE